MVLSAMKIGVMPLTWDGLHTCRPHPHMRGVTPIPITYRIFFSSKDVQSQCGCSTGKREWENGSSTYRKDSP